MIISSSNLFYLDYVKGIKYDIEKLKKENKLLRVISSDRVGDHYMIDEYIDNDVYIPVRNEQTNKMTVSNNANSSGNNNDNDDSGDGDKEALLQAKLDAALLKIQLLETKLKLNKKTKTSCDSAPAAIGPYSQAVKYDKFLYLSGCLGVDPRTSQLVDGTVENQCKTALANMKNIIDSSGCTVDNIVKTTIYLTNLAAFHSVNSIYSDFFLDNSNTESPLPARTTIGINALPLNALIEIEAIVIAEK